MKKMDFIYDVKEYETIFFKKLSEHDKRLFAGLEAMKLGYNGVAEIANKFGINKHTVRRGKKELLTGIDLPQGKVRKKGGGRKKKPKV
jgi:transposase